MAENLPQPVAEDQKKNPPTREEMNAHLQEANKLAKVIQQEEAKLGKMKSRAGFWHRFGFSIIGMAAGSGIAWVLNKIPFLAGRETKWVYWENGALAGIGGMAAAEMANSQVAAKYNKQLVQVELLKQERKEHLTVVAEGALIESMHQEREKPNYTAREDAKREQAEEKIPTR